MVSDGFLAASEAFLRQSAGKAWSGGLQLDMFYDHAEVTRRLIEELGGRAFRDLNYDAMQGAGALIEAYLLAFDQEDDTALDQIDTDARAWIKGLPAEALEAEEGRTDL